MLILYHNCGTLRNQPAMSSLSPWKDSAMMESEICGLAAPDDGGFHAPPRWASEQARQIFRDLVDTPADVTISESEVHVRFHRRAHLPIISASGIMDSPVNVPWWNKRTLRMSA